MLSPKVRKTFTVLSILLLPAYAPIGLAVSIHLPSAYIEADVGSNLVSVDVRQNETPTAGPIISRMAGFVWEADFGYQFNPYWAVELGFSQYKQSKSHNTVEVTDLVAKGIWPLAERFKPFGKLGMTYLFPEAINGKMLVPYLGVGFAVVINSYSEFTVQATGFAIGPPSLGALLLGFTIYLNP